MKGAEGQASNLLIMSVISILLVAVILGWILNQSSFFAKGDANRMTPPVMRTLNESVYTEPMRGNVRIPEPDEKPQAISSQAAPESVSEAESEVEQDAAQAGVSETVQEEKTDPVKQSETKAAETGPANPAETEAEVTKVEEIPELQPLNTALVEEVQTAADVVTEEEPESVPVNVTETENTENVSVQPPAVPEPDPGVEDNEKVVSSVGIADTAAQPPAVPDPEAKRNGAVTTAEVSRATVDRVDAEPEPVASQALTDSPDNTVASETPESVSPRREQSGWIYAGEYVNGRWVRSGLQIAAAGLPEQGGVYTLTWRANVRAAPPGKQREDGSNLGKTIDSIAVGQEVEVTTVKNSGRTGHIWLEIRY